MSLFLAYRISQKKSFKDLIQKSLDHFSKIEKDSDSLDLKSVRSSNYKAFLCDFCEHHSDSFGVTKN